MKLLAIVLVALLGSSSFAAAQSSGSGISILPPTTKDIPKANPTTTTGANTDTTQSKDKSNPTNALDDNRVSKTTGNPPIQSGPVK